MRNLKRALSLALAAVMVIGMMVVGAGAVGINDFSDADEIVNKDAVAMVSALGIINGLPNNTYGPTQNIDRASFVKMVALAYNGGNEPMLPSGARVSYVDTAGTWASAYIEYCTNLGFVSGDGTTGRFNPAASVTVSQAAKMLLTALGFNAEIEGYVGPDWQMNVDSAANTSGLYSGLSGDTSASLTRDQAAQMIYNALSATMVKYEYVINGINASTSQATARPQVTTSGMKTMLEEKFGAYRVDGVVLANDYAALTGSIRDEGKSYIDIIDAPDDFNITSGTFTVASDPDMLGKTVSMFVKPASNNSTDASKATVLGGLILSDINTVATVTNTRTATSLTNYLRGEGIRVTSATQYYINYVLQTGQPTTNTRGVETTFIDNNDDGVADYAIQMVKTFGQVNGYNASGDGTFYASAVNASSLVSGLVGTGSNVILTISSSDAAEEVVGFEDVAAEDYIFFYKIDDTYYVEKAEYVDATVSAIRGSDITAGGTSYSQSGLVATVNDDTQVLADAVDIDDEVRLYLDGNGCVVYTDSVNTTTDYLYVASSDTYSVFDGSIRLRVVFMDGTTATVTADDENLGSWLTGSSSTLPSGIFSYSVNSRSVYTLTPVTGSGVSATITRGNANIGGAVANNSTVFVVDRDGNPARAFSGSISVYTGIANVPTMNSVVGTAVVRNGVARVVFITDSTLTGNTESIYVLDKDPSVTRDTNGDRIYTYDVIYDGAKTTLTGANNLFDTNEEGLYINVNVSGGEVTGVGSSTFVQAGEAKRASNGVISYVSANDGVTRTYTYTSDTVFLIADGTDVSVASVGAIIADTTGTITGSNIVVLPDSENTNVAGTVVICE